MLEFSRKPILIFGPTASGKSALALRLAEAEPSALIVNADSLQVYDVWRVLTARPSAEDEARAPHALYGHVAAERADYSVGAWLRELQPLLLRAAADGATPIIVGGSGLNFSKLTQGLAEIPPAPDALRAEAEAADPARLLAELDAEDAATAAALDRKNPRRIQRAWVVLRATGRGLSAWAAATPPPLLALERCRAAVVSPERDRLAERIERRLSRMVEDGALAEVAAARARGLDLAGGLPGAQALGARAFAAHLDGALTLEAALADAAAATRQYAKRQRTWARNQLGLWPRFENADAAARALG